MNDHKKIFKLCLYGLLCLLIIILFCGQNRGDRREPSSNVAKQIEQIDDNNKSVQAGIECTRRGTDNISSRIDNSQTSIKCAKERITEVRTNLNEAEKLVRECQEILQETRKEPDTVDIQ